MHPPRIGPYLIDRKIGAGGMGMVYVGRHEQTAQVAAVKVLPASLAREPGFILRFNREIDALQRLNHTNIVKFYETGAGEDETYFYAMEYIEGDTLTGRLRRDGKIPWRDAIQIAVQICAGLKHAHDVGVIHRDLKPSNLLISSDGVIKITDFGVAQVFAADQLTIPGAVIGTAEFMSPEQVEGRRADRRSDLYSLGAVLYTMLVGQPPFFKGSPAEIMQKQRFGRFDPPRSYVTEIPSWLDDIVCQLLEKSPEKRLPDAYVVSKRLQEVILKVDLKNSTGVASPNPEAETRLDAPVAPGNALGATLVRDLVRAQNSRREVTTSFDRLFNNIWFLLAMLVIVLAGLVWLWPAGDSTPGSPSVGPASEPERILQTARWQWKTGDAAGARRQLEALRSIIADDDENKALVRSVDKLLATIRNQRPTFQRAFIRQGIERAATLERTNPAQARSILESLLFLYDEDRSVSDLVKDIRQTLKSLGAESSADTPAESSQPESPSDGITPSAGP